MDSEYACILFLPLTPALIAAHVVFRRVDWQKKRRFNDVRCERKRQVRDEAAVGSQASTEHQVT